MALRSKKTEASTEPATAATEPAPLAPRPQAPIDGVADRGAESGVPFYHDSAGRRFVGGDHPSAGDPW